MASFGPGPNPSMQAPLTARGQPQSLSNSYPERPNSARSVPSRSFADSPRDGRTWRSKMKAYFTLATPQDSMKLASAVEEFIVFVPTFFTKYEQNKKETTSTLVQISSNVLSLLKKFPEICEREEILKAANEQIEKYQEALHDLLFFLKHGHPKPRPNIDMDRLNDNLDKLVDASQTKQDRTEVDIARLEENLQQLVTTSTDGKPSPRVPPSPSSSSSTPIASPSPLRSSSFDSPRVEPGTDMSHVRGYLIIMVTAISAISETMEDRVIARMGAKCEEVQEDVKALNECKERRELRSGGKMRSLMIHSGELATALQQRSSAPKFQKENQVVDDMLGCADKINNEVTEYTNALRKSIEQKNRSYVDSAYINMIALLNKIQDLVKWKSRSESILDVDAAQKALEGLQASIISGDRQGMATQLKALNEEVKKAKAQQASLQLDDGEGMEGGSAHASFAKSKQKRTEVDIGRLEDCLASLVRTTKDSLSQNLVNAEENLKKQLENMQAVIQEQEHKKDEDDPFEECLASLSAV